MFKIICTLQKILDFLQPSFYNDLKCYPSNHPFVIDQKGKLSMVYLCVVADRFIRIRLDILTHSRLPCDETIPRRLASRIKWKAERDGLWVRSRWYYHPSSWNNDVPWRPHMPPPQIRPRVVDDWVRQANPANWQVLAFEPLHQVEEGWRHFRHCSFPHHS